MSTRTSTAASTTIRVPTELRNEISSLAASRGESMVDVVADAISRLRRDEWWREVHAALDRLDEADVAALGAEAVGLDATAGDGF